MTYGNALDKIFGTNTCHSIKKFVNKQTCTNNHMFKRGFGDKFTEFAFFKLWNRKFEKISRFENFKEWAR